MPPRTEAASRRGVAEQAPSRRVSTTRPEQLVPDATVAHAPSNLWGKARQPAGDRESLRAKILAAGEARLRKPRAKSSLIRGIDFME